jgi:hypothetical protein
MILLMKKILMKKKFTYIKKIQKGNILRARQKIN